MKPGTHSHVHLHDIDNVILATRDLEADSRLHVGGIPVRTNERIPRGHKIALSPIKQAERVFKFGQAIGLATADIAPGDWVHCHNLSTAALALDYAIAAEIPPDPAPITDRTFLGYRRASGRSGTRNYIAVISNVNCSATVSKHVADRFDASQLQEYPNVDGVVAFSHYGGCGVEFNGSMHQMLNRTMGGIARHPNIGAYLIIGLGCEQVTIGHLISEQHLVQIDGHGSPQPGPPVFSMQDCGGTVATVEAASQRLAELLPIANDVCRESIPASEIVLGTECGGSDGQSGFTANPAVGIASDMLVACGGTSILAETPEIYGAEHLLTRRARSEEVARKLIDRIEWWKWYTGIHGGEIDNNPSVGNKAGGLTTIEEKSLGAVAKGGSTALEDVYEYAEPVVSKGLVVMDTPGFDPMSVTGMVAGGANVVVFTTGRGSCFGCKPTPSIKITSNTDVFERLSDDMDLDAGGIATGRSVHSVGEEIFNEVLAVASGKKTKSEIHGFGDQEFLPWTVGPQL